MLSREAATATRDQKQPSRILDIGTGSGCIALGLTFALKQRGIRCKTLGIDVSDSAVLLARDNVQRCSGWMPKEVDIAQADLFSSNFVREIRVLCRQHSSSDNFDIVVSNPPYIPREQYNALAPSVKNHEDREALIGEHASSDNDRDGLIYYRRIVSLLHDLVDSGARAKEGQLAVAFEVGTDQAHDVADMLEDSGFSTTFIRDQWNVERVVVGRHRIVR
ncbi:hypothetical protein OIO90_003597 [Microbotryomycetes sp. JL221]|nr:hypothetical protein OIO90_003597 [Microbotryomycetes sp. JL221]